MASPNASAEARMRRTLARRKRAEWRFRMYGKMAVLAAMAALCWLLYSIVGPGVQGFFQHRIQVKITQPMVAHADGNAQKLVTDALMAMLPEGTDKNDGRTRRLAGQLLSQSALFVWKENMPAKLPAHVWLPLSDRADQLLKGRQGVALSDQQKTWLGTLYEHGMIQKHFNVGFFTRGDSRDPDQAGFAGSMAGSLMTLALCFAVSFVVGALSAIYLQEFAPRNGLTAAIEVTINNLAAVPSILYGLLGLAVFLNVCEMPRSSAVVGGLTLSLMTLPIMIISARVALAAVPSSIRDAARALGASDQQVVWHHVVPYALSGMMTGTILGLARAIGETAPLLMVGMVAFVVDIPQRFTDAATAMPVQIYLWASSPEMGFVEKTSSGIIVLLLLLLAMNALAGWVRKKTQVRWF